MAPIRPDDVTLRPWSADDLGLLLGAHDFEYPPGNWLHCNGWAYDVAPGSVDGPD